MQPASFRQNAAANALVERVAVSAYKIPTETPESDGTLEWDATTMVLVELASDGMAALGYTYADVATAKLIEEKLVPLIERADPFATQGLWTKMVGAIRNLGRPGIASMAIAAVDNAIWDLKARLLDVPLFRLLGAASPRVPVYGSGGFTSYSIDRLQQQLAGWADDGIPRVKMKVGREPHRDYDRVLAARYAIGERTELFVDANGAYDVKQAIEFAHRFAGLGVTWFEEPVYHRDFAGTRRVREASPASVEVSLGEYGYDAFDFAAMLDSRGIDVLQADVTRCEGVTGFLGVDSLCQARAVPLSTHCAPAITAHAAAAAKQLRHLEYFHDHARIERMFFDGLPPLRDGAFDLSGSGNGNGLEFKRKDAERYKL